MGLGYFAKLDLLVKALVNDDETVIERVCTNCADKHYFLCVRDVVFPKLSVRMTGTKEEQVEAIAHELLDLYRAGKWVTCGEKTVVLNGMPVRVPCPFLDGAVRSVVLDDNYNIVADTPCPAETPNPTPAAETPEEVAADVSTVTDAAVVTAPVAAGTGDEETAPEISAADTSSAALPEAPEMSAVETAKDVVVPVSEAAEETDFLPLPQDVQIIFYHTHVRDAIKFALETAQFDPNHFARIPDTVAVQCVLEKIILLDEYKTVGSAELLHVMAKTLLERSQWLFVAEEYGKGVNDLLVFLNNSVANLRSTNSPPPVDAPAESPAVESAPAADLCIEDNLKEEIANLPGATMEEKMQTLLLSMGQSMATFCSTTFGTSTLYRLNHPLFKNHVEKGGWMNREMCSVLFLQYLLKMRKIFAPAVISEPVVKEETPAGPVIHQFLLNGDIDWFFSFRFGDETKSVHDILGEVACSQRRKNENILSFCFSEMMRIKSIHPENAVLYVIGDKFDTAQPVTTLGQSLWTDKHSKVFHFSTMETFRNFVIMVEMNKRARASEPKQ